MRRGNDCPALGGGSFFFFFFPLPLRSDVFTRILGRLFQMHTSALFEDSASCACRVARPQPRGSSVGQQSDGQHHSPPGRDGRPQVSARRDAPHS